jgi:hypothetical protein
MLMSVLYSVYTNLFWCRRGCLRTFFQEDEPRKTLDIVVPPPTHPWVYITAVWSDEEEEDVTAIVTEKVTPDEVLTPERLLEITGLIEEHTTGEDSVTTSRRVVKWEYMNSQTFEVGEITSEGLVNAVKPKID